MSDNYSVMVKLCEQQNGIGCSVFLNNNPIVYYHYKEFDEKFNDIPQFEYDYQICYHTFEFFKLLSKNQCQI